MPLGVLPFPTYEEASAPLEPGQQRCVLYTDGLIERPASTSTTGSAQLAARVARRAARTRRRCSTTCSTSLVPAGGARRTTWRC